jgi:hypothetical protein
MLALQVLTDLPVIAVVTLTRPIHALAFPRAVILTDGFRADGSSPAFETQALRARSVLVLRNTDSIVGTDVSLVVRVAHSYGAIPPSECSIALTDTFTVAFTVTGAVIRALCLFAPHSAVAGEAHAVTVFRGSSKQ